MNFRVSQRTGVSIFVRNFNNGDTRATFLRRVVNSVVACRM